MRAACPHRHDRHDRHDPHARRDRRDRHGRPACPGLRGSARHRGALFTGACVAAVLACLLGLARPAWAVHKCVEATGRVSYSDAPCAADARGGHLPIAPNQIDGAGEAAEAGAAFVQREQARQTAERQAVQARDAALLQAWSRPAPSTTPDPSGADCRQALKDYEWVSRGRPGRDAGLSAEAAAVRTYCGAQALPAAARPRPPRPPYPREPRPCAHERDSHCPAR